MKERSLVAFTLLSQAAVGLWWLQAGVAPTAPLAEASHLTAAALMALALGSSFLHLGTPLLAWRAIFNVRSSWLSREVLSASLFAAASLVLVLFRLGNLAVWLTAALGAVLLYCMAQAYRLRTVPAWDAWSTPASFLVTALLLGGLVTDVLAVLTPGGVLEMDLTWPRGTAPVILLLLAVQGALLWHWLRRLRTGPDAARRSAGRVTKRHRALLRARLALGVGGAVAVAAFWLPWPSPTGPTALAFLALGLVAAGEAAGRELFYQARVREGV